MSKFSGAKASCPPCCESTSYLLPRCWGGENSKLAEAAGEKASSIALGLACFMVPGDQAECGALYQGLWLGPPLIPALSVAPEIRHDSADLEV